MSFVKAAVYDPPRSGLPHVAVVFDPKGEVLVARTVPSVAAGEAFLKQIFAEMQKKIDEDLRSQTWEDK